MRSAVLLPKIAKRKVSRLRSRGVALFIFTEEAKRLHTVIGVEINCEMFQPSSSFFSDVKRNKFGCLAKAI